MSSKTVIKSSVYVVHNRDGRKNLQRCCRMYFTAYLKTESIPGGEVGDMVGDAQTQINLRAVLHRRYGRTTFGTVVFSTPDCLPGDGENWHLNH